MKLPEAKRTHAGVTLEGKKLEFEQIVNQVREVLATHLDEQTASIEVIAFEPNKAP